MRISRLAVVVAAAAIALPAGMASMAMADDAPAGGAVSVTPKDGKSTSPEPGKHRGRLTDDQRSCMEQKGFGGPRFSPGERPERPSREEMQKRREEFQKRREERMKPPTREEMQKRHEEMQKRRDEMQKRSAERAEAAKACGLPERPQWGGGGPEGHGKGGPGHMQRRGPQVTDEQRACMEKKGFGRPSGERPKERPTREEMAKKRSEFESAAKECGLQMPQRRGPGGPGGPGAYSQVAPAGMNA